MELRARRCAAEGSAESGELYTRKGRAKAVNAMLASSRLEDGVRALLRRHDGLQRFRQPRQRSEGVSERSPARRWRMRASRRCRTIVDHLLTKQADYRDLFTDARYVHVDEPRGDLRRADREWLGAVHLPEGSQRGGLADPGELPGRSRASGAQLGDPPRQGAARAVPLPDRADAAAERGLPRSSTILIRACKTARERLKVHTTNASCAGCHKIMDPMGYPLEHFDGAGQFRATENGAPLDTSGTLDGVAFKDVAGLGKALHDHPALPACLVNRVYSYGTGGPTSVSQDKLLLEHFKERFAKAGYKLPDLLRDIALGDCVLPKCAGAKGASLHRRTKTANSGKPAPTSL